MVAGLAGRCAWDVLPQFSERPLTFIFKHGTVGRDEIMPEVKVYSLGGAPVSSSSSPHAVIPPPVPHPPRGVIATPRASYFHGVEWGLPLRSPRVVSPLIQCIHDSSEVSLNFLCVIVLLCGGLPSATHPTIVPLEAMHFQGEGKSARSYTARTQTQARPKWWRVVPQRIFSMRATETHTANAPGASSVGSRS